MTDVVASGRPDKNRYCQELNSYYHVPNALTTNNSGSATVSPYKMIIYTAPVSCIISNLDVKVNVSGFSQDTSPSLRFTIWGVFRVKEGNSSSGTLPTLYVNQSNAAFSNVDNIFNPFAGEVDDIFYINYTIVQAQVPWNINGQTTFSFQQAGSNVQINKYNAEIWPLVLHENDYIVFYYTGQSLQSAYGTHTPQYTSTEQRINGLLTFNITTI